MNYNTEKKILYGFSFCLLFQVLGGRVNVRETYHVWYYSVLKTSVSSLSSVCQTRKPGLNGRVVWPSQHPYLTGWLLCALGDKSADRILETNSDHVVKSCLIQWMKCKSKWCQTTLILLLFLKLRFFLYHYCFVYILWCLRSKMFGCRELWLLFPTVSELT